MQLLDEHLWQLYDIGKITLDEMLVQSRQPGMLQDKATAKHKALRTKEKRKAATKEMEDLGTVFRA
jgi:Tfp pilus assembly ATPase PilU